jgi:hypothetical protein
MANILVAASPAPGHFNPMLSVAKHLSSIGHSITFLSGSLFRDQAVALGFRFVPLSGKAGFNYMRLNEEFPERAAAKPGPEALNAECIYTGIDPIPDQYRAIRQILSEGAVDLIVTEVYFWGVFPMLLGPRDARPPVLTFGVLPLILSGRDVSPLSGPDTSLEGRLRNQRETRQFYAMMQPAATHFNDVLHSCGSPNLPELFMDCAGHLPDRFLALTAEAFEYPRSDMKKTIHFIGNLMPNAHGKTSMPVWWDSLEESKPVVLISQGTIANRDFSQLIEPAIAALANEQMTVIVAAGRPDLEAIRLPGGSKPENTKIEMTVLAQISVRPGIILLLLSDSILSSKAESAGQALTARLVQNSPLAERFTSKTGNTTVGHTIELNATADAAGPTTSYRFDEFTAYKKHSLIPVCSRSVHSSKNAVAVQASQSRQGDCTPQETATTDPIVGGSVAVAEHLLRRFLSYHPTA